MQTHQFIDHTNKTPENLGTENANLNRAYASMLLSLVNYGYNVANRRPFPAKSYAYKETGKSTELSSEEQYIRTEVAHPSRKILSTIGELINSHQKQMEAKFKRITALVTLITNNQASLKNSSVNDIIAQNTTTREKANPNKNNKDPLHIIGQSLKSILEYEEIKQQTSETSCLSIDDLMGILKSEMHRLKNELPTEEKGIKQALTILAEGKALHIDHSATTSALKKAKSEEEKKTIKRKAKNKTIYGQLLTPEMCLEKAFAIIPTRLVKTICQNLLDKQMETLIAINMPSAKIKNADDNKNNSTLLDRTESDHKNLTYSALLNRRVVFVKNTVNMATKSQLKLLEENKNDASILSNPLIKMIAPETDYPCVIFNIEPLLLELEINPKAYPEPRKDKLNNFILTFFCALLNYYSLLKYGDGFIWTETQNSFGSIRPSITDTGNSFRFSPGLVPDNYSEVIVDAYQDLCIALPKLIDLLKNKNRQEKTADTNKKNDRYSSDSYLYDANEHGMRGIIHMIAFKIIADKKNEQNSTTDALKEFFLFVTQNKKKFNLDKENSFNEAHKIIASGTPHNQVPLTSTAPNEAIILLKNLIHLAKQEKNVSYLSDNLTIASQVEKFINEKLSQLTSINLSDYTWDYSLTCTCIEHLMRLLKLKEDVKKIHGYTHENNVDDTLSDDSCLSIDAFPTTGGMASLKTLIGCILPDLDQKYIDAVIKKKAGDDIDPALSIKNDVYFEITDNAILAISDTIASLEEIRAQSTPNGISIKVIDMAQIPTQPNSKKNLWVTEKDWSNLDNPDILIIDVTTSDTEALHDMLTKLQNSCPSTPPYYIVTFSSDHKFNGGVDLVSMGEIRIHPNCSALSNALNTTAANSQRVEKVQACIDRIQNELNLAHENTLSARNMRKMLENIGARRSLSEKADSFTNQIILTAKAQSFTIDTLVNNLMGYISYKASNKNEKSVKKFIAKIEAQLTENDLAEAIETLHRKLLTEMPARCGYLANNHNNQDALSHDINIPMSIISTEHQKVPAPQLNLLPNHEFAVTNQAEAMAALNLLSTTLQNSSDSLINIPDMEKFESAIDDTLQVKTNHGGHRLAIKNI